MNRNKVFFLSAIGISFGAVGLVGLFNFMVNPYGIFKNNFFPAQSKIAGKHQRLIKAIEIVREKPKAIILGTSRVGNFDEQHSQLANVQPVLNLSLAGSSIYEQRRYLEHTIEHQPDLELVVIGIDFFAFGSGFSSQPGFVESRLGKQFRFQDIAFEDVKNTLFSLDSLQDSWERIWLEKKNKNVKQSSSNKSNEKDDLSISLQVIKSYIKRKDRYNNYQLSQDKLADLKSIVELCQTKDIELVVIISPIHATLLETIYESGLWEEFFKWKEELVNITPVWDFSGYSSITTEPLNQDMKNFDDPSHFNRKIGNLILEKIFKPDSKLLVEDNTSFGILLNQQTFKEQREKSKRDRYSWLKAHQKDVKVVQELFER